MRIWPEPPVAWMRAARIVSDVASAMAAAVLWSLGCATARQTAEPARVGVEAIDETPINARSGRLLVGRPQ